MREAQEGSLLVTNMIVREKESDIAQDVAMRQDIEENMGPAQPSEQVESRQLREGADELWRSIGIAIETSGPSVIVTRVMTKSPAYTAGIKPQDEIISIWGKLVKYMPLTGVYDMFLSSKVSEIRLAIEREKRPALKKKFFFRSTEDMIGARLSMDLDGLTVAQVRPGGPFDNSNILKGDRITMLGGVSTRYMPLESACKMIEKVKDGSLEIGIQREVTVWRR
jgi:C-terminal processing protease CtpA/Prc